MAYILIQQNNSLLFPQVRHCCQNSRNFALEQPKDHAVHARFLYMNGQQSFNESYLNIRFVLQSSLATLV